MGLKNTADKSSRSCERPAWNLGEMPQAKETYLKRLADVLIGQMGTRMMVPGELGRLSDETIELKLKILNKESGGYIDIGDGVTAYACEEIIEFYRGDEDLGVCTYARYATQVRKKMRIWKPERKERGR